MNCCGISAGSSKAKVKQYVIQLCAAVTVRIFASDYIVFTSHQDIPLVPTEYREDRDPVVYYRSTFSPAAAITTFDF